jgi:TonB family protein
MMSAHVNTPQKDESLDLYVKKFQSICDMHHVPLGSPEDFPGFMQKLAEDRHFAMDFWALTGRLSSREGGQLSDEQMLAVIVDSITGRDVHDADGVFKKLVDDLARLLAGVDLYGPTEQSDVKTVALPSVFPPGTGSQGFAEDVKRVAGKEPSTTDADSHPLSEALLRLEQNNLLLKEHLDSLDNKVSRIEPHLEELTSIVSSASSPSPKERARGRVEEPVLRPVGSSRSILEPRRASFADDDEDDPSIPIPLEGYSHRGGQRRIVFFVVLLLAVAGGLFAQHRYGSSLWQSYGVALRERYSSLLEKMHGAGSAVSSTNQSAPQSAAAGSAPAAAPTSDSSSANPPSAPNAPASSAPVAGSSSASEQAATKQTATKQTAPASGEPQASDNESSPRSRRKAMSSHAVAVAAAAAASSGGDDAGAIKVAPAVMEANLISSRVPAYPEAAKVNHIEGPVVMQAVISKDGTVTRVNILEGDRRLRDAASEAVRRWRYRPHLVNGRPVDVVTIVTVDFELDQ